MPVRTPVVAKPKRTPVKAKRTPVRTPVLAPLTVQHSEFDVLLYLTRLISDKEGLIFLYGDHPSMCQVRTYSFTEDSDSRHRAWIERDRAREMLKAHYFRKGNNRTSKGVPSEVWQCKTERKRTVGEVTAETWVSRGKRM